MHLPGLAPRLLALLESDAAPAPAVPADSADADAVARVHGLLRARDGSPPTRLIEDHTELRAAGEVDPRADGLLAQALTAYTAERERVRRAVLERMRHDLRNALGAITLTAQRWARHPPADPRDDAALLLRQVAQMQALGESLRPEETGSADAASLLVWTRADLAGECRESLLELRAAHPRLAIVFEAAGPVPARCDTYRVHEALSQLLACLAWRGAASVTVTVRREPPGRAVLQVAGADRHGAVPEDRRWQERIAWLLLRQTAQAHGGGVQDEGDGATLWLPAQE